MGVLGEELAGAPFGEEPASARMASGSDERRYDPTDREREQAYTLKEF